MAYSLIAVEMVQAARYDGELTIVTIDEQTKSRIPVRMELRDGRGRPVRVRAEGAISHGDYFVFDGEVTLQLKKGPYTFLIEAGSGIRNSTRSVHDRTPRRRRHRSCDAKASRHEG